MLAKGPWKILGILALAQAGIIVCYLAVFAKDPAPARPGPDKDIVVQAAPADAPLTVAKSEPPAAAKEEKPKLVQIKEETPKPVPPKPVPMDEANALPAGPPKDEPPSPAKQEAEIRLSAPAPDTGSWMKPREDVLAKGKAPHCEQGEKVSPPDTDKACPPPEKKEEPKPAESAPDKAPVGMAHPEPVDKPAPAPSVSEAATPPVGDKSKPASGPAPVEPTPPAAPESKPTAAAAADSGPVPPPAATAPVKTVVAPKPCPWTLRVALVDGKTHLTAQTGKEVRFRVVCDQLNLQAPCGNIEAQGTVKLASSGLEGSCDRLTISWQEDQVVLEGSAKLKCYREGQNVELKAARLSLRLTRHSACEEVSKATHHVKHKGRGISFVP
jgi:hypothetical protein